MYRIYTMTQIYWIVIISNLFSMTPEAKEKYIFSSARFNFNRKICLVTKNRHFIILYSWCVTRYTK